MTINWQPPSYEYEGYGVYDFDHPLRGYGQLPPGVSVEDVVANMDQYIVIVGGLQVASTEVQQPVMDVLDKMDFTPDGDESGSLITGTAQFVLFDLFGSDFASTYRSAGYAILVDKASVKTGTPRIIITKLPGVIAKEAAAGGPYVIVSAPAELVDAASKLLAVQPAPAPTPAPTPTPTPAPAPKPKAPTKAGAELPGWVAPAAIVGVAAVAAVFIARGGKKKR